MSIRIYKWTMIAILVLSSALPVMAREEVYYFINDHLGTPQKLVDKDAQVVWEAEALPFGETMVNEDPDGDGKTVTCNLRFPGQYYDAETGWHYNYHRYYDPKLGRYLRADPVGDFINPQRFTYCGNNPNIYSDETGEKYECKGGKWQGECEMDLYNVGKPHLFIDARMHCPEDCVTCFVKYECRQSPGMVIGGSKLFADAKASSIYNGEDFGGSIYYTNLKVFRSSSIYKKVFGVASLEMELHYANTLGLVKFDAYGVIVGRSFRQPLTDMVTCSSSQVWCYNW